MKRAISIYGTRLYIPTSDAHIVALDAKTGKVAWDEAIADAKAGYGLTGGPLVANGKVMVGTTGRAPGGNFIVALDAETGKRAWRINTIAQPGENGGNSWNGLPTEKRNGASVWVPGSYDRVLNLAFFGPAQTYDTGPLRNRSDEANVTNDGLYTDSTLAINVDTGRLVWFFQHQPNDQWDLDWAFERHILPLQVGGTTRPVVVTGGKQAIFDVMEADTGKYVFSMDLGLQNVVTSIDPRTGGKVIDDRLVPGDGETKFVCPHAGGAKSWLPSSYNPRTKILYVSLVESCMDLDAGRTGWTRQPLDGCAVEPAAATEQRRTLRTHSGHQSRHAQDRVDQPSARADDDGHAGDSRRCRLRRRTRSHVRGVRRDDGRATVADASRRRAEQRADQLYGERPPVRGDGRRQRRRAGGDVPGIGSGDPQSSGSRCVGVGVCAAGTAAPLRPSIASRAAGPR